MRTLKKTAAGVLALTMAFAGVGCGGDKKDDTKSSSEYEQQVEVEVTASAKDIAALPGGEESTITYLGENDLNPTKANKEMSVELKLFEQKGGKIKFVKTANQERFDKLASSIITGVDRPDIFKHEWLAFPSQIIQERYLPINDLVDFDSPLWSDVKSTAEQYMFNGNYYVAPLDFVPSAMIFYDKAMIQENALDDPYDLYMKGEWNWDSFHELMSDYVNGGTADAPRYGVNGFFKPHIVQQTGKTMITKNGDTFINNTADPDIERAETFLYDITKEGLVFNDWIGGARDCFSKNILFYGMGDWAATGNQAPKEDETWGVVPMPEYPNNPQKITTSDMTAYMWVTQSTKGDAVKCWFECVRASKTDPEYVESNKQTFFANNPYWTEEMYQVKMDVVSKEYLQIFDYGFGVSANLGDRNSFDGNQCLIDALYGDVTVIDEEGSQSTWTQVRDQYKSIIDSEIKKLNEDLEKFKTK